MIYVVKEDGLYHTGEFSRELPPSAYLGSLSDARTWDNRQDAQRWADNFGGTVVHGEADVLEKIAMLEERIEAISELAEKLKAEIELIKNDKASSQR